MVFLILIYLVLVSLPLPWPEPLVGGGLGVSLTATAILTVLPILAAWFMSRRTRRRLLAEPYRRDELLMDSARHRVRHLLALMALHGMSLTIFGWGWAVRTLCGAERPSELPFAAELLVMAPFFIALVSSWAAFYTIEKSAAEVSTCGLHEELPYGGRWSYVVFLSRQHLALISVPLGLFLIQQGIVRQFPAAFDSTRMHALVIGVALLALLLAPWFLRLMFSTEKLPASPIRDRLEAAARRLNLRYSDILLWNTHSGVANAMVAGPLPWVRYVFLSDRLIDTLPPDEIEAVFGHEAGHVRHGHFLYYLLFIALSLFAIGGLWATGLSLALGDMTESEWHGWEPWLLIPQVALIGAYMFVAFGFLSRRCERQADLFGCRAVSCTDPNCTGHSPETALAPKGRGLCPTGIRTFIRALDRVAAVNGISRRKPGWLQSWLHSTIAKRVAFLEGVIADPTTAVRFQRRVGFVKWAWLGALTGIFIALGVAGFWEHLWTAL